MINSVRSFLQIANVSAFYILPTHLCMILPVWSIPTVHCTTVAKLFVMALLNIQIPHIIWLVGGNVMSD